MPKTDNRNAEDPAPSARTLPEYVISNADLPNIRRTLGVILLVLMTLALYFAKDVILPLLLGTLLALTLSPIVRALHRQGLPHVVSASGLILLITLALAGAALLFSGPISGWIDDAPQLGAELKAKLKVFASSIAIVQQASNQVDQITADVADPDVQRVALESPGILTMAATNVASVLGTTLVSLVLALFLLASGDMFYVKLIDAFPRFGDKKRALRIVYGIEKSVARYLAIVTVINVVLGMVIGLGLWAIGMPQPIVWALISVFVNYLPYIGPLLGSALVTAVAIVSFDSLGHAALAPVIYLTATTIEGQFVTPVVLGRQLELNAVSIFVTVVFWGWLWGIAGALMAVPFLVCLKVVCDQIEPMRTLGSFLSGEPTAQTNPVSPAIE